MAPLISTKHSARTMIAGCVLLMAMAMLMTMAAPAQRESTLSDESSKVLSLENAWNQAERRHDVRALNLLLADIFEYTDSDGSFMNRGQWLAMIKNGNDQYEQLGNSGMIVHMYGNVAIVTGMYTEKGRVKARMVMRSGRFTDTWIKENTGWRCVASQSTLIAP